jgi:predicted nucleic acid-binding protein
VKTDKHTEETTQYVIDASVAVKWFCEESGREAALKISRSAKLGDIALYAPELLLYEVGNVLWKGKKFSTNHLQRVLFALSQTNIEFFALERDIVETAALFTTTYDITFYDASYAALAYKFQIPLISENPKDHKKIKEIVVQGLADW